MKGDRTPNYGIDAPGAVRNLFLVAALGMISLIFAGLGSAAMGAWMLYDSKIGKQRERETYLDRIARRGLSRTRRSKSPTRSKCTPGDARKLPFDDASFDVVLSSVALHNIHNAGDRQTAVREIARVTKPGGRVRIVAERGPRPILCRPRSQLCSELVTRARTAFTRARIAVNSACAIGFTRCSSKPTSRTRARVSASP